MHKRVVRLIKAVLACILIRSPTFEISFADRKTVNNFRLPKIRIFLFGLLLLGFILASVNCGLDAEFDHAHGLFEFGMRAELTALVCVVLEQVRH
jgi:hypothetical protein